MTQDVASRVAAVWRIEAARVVAGLARVVHEVGLAEDLAQDALVAALEQWPASGVPDNPAAWLTAVARRRYVDSVRRAVTYERKLAEIGHERQEVADPMADIDVETTVADDVLRLMFTACHPVLAPEARVALTLRMVGGLTTDEIARAYLVPVPTMAARITRAKKALRAAGVPFEVPSGPELPSRLASVLEVVYLVFNEGYAASSGATWTRPVLCEEAMRLGRMLAALAPPEPEAHGLVALMELQASRLRARVSAAGEPVQLPDQDRSRWDRTLITHALAALARAESFGGAGPYVLQAQIAACHARAARAEDTDWARIAERYDALVEVTGSPVVELNRAVAVAMAGDPAEALAIVDDLIAEDLPALRGYHLVPAVRGDVLARLGHAADAAAEFRRAAELCDNEQERAVLQRRARGDHPGGAR
ncbi:RNA polymerase, sigma subunit, ECF family [Jatrophihabitans endophyticus]|uniref:RNA polymerase sigma factor n=1 Tax=Jatrophihabitans endophyticus TaxID=1206085 RepID=A0A1M5TSK0_9ACTN|nr:RNA polymerase sigma factor [Jatrophihabitans endophyticus]SHH53373.1 RNA polymerase, sigma subunit, ECF family [Jatrophihabitans endophyticus]